MIANRSPLFLLGIAVATLAGLFAITHMLPILGASDQMVAVRAVVQIAASIALLVVLVRGAGEPRTALGLQPFRLSTLGWALLCFVAAIAIGAIAGLLMKYLGYGQNADVVRALLSRPIWLLLLIAASAGITEEIVFRSVLISHIEAAVGNSYVAAAVSLILFGAAHISGWGPSKFFGAMAPGLILTLFFLWKRNLLICVIAHFLVDAVSLVTAAELLRHH